MSFDESGEVVEAAGISDEDKSRVEVTKDILGLNKIQTLIEARQQKWQECFRHIQDFLKANKRAEPTRTAFKACAINELRKLVKEDKEFLAVALACILKKAPEHLQNAIF